MAVKGLEIRQGLVRETSGEGSGHKSHERAVRVAVWRGLVAACRRQEARRLFLETDFEKRLIDLKAAGIQTLEPMRGEKLDVVILADPMAIRLCLLMERLRAIER